MRKAFSKTLTALTAAACVLSAVPASAQRHRDSDRDGRSDARELGRDRDRDGVPDQYDRNDRRSDRNGWSYYGDRHGYQGYRGQWRTGQRYTYWRDRNYYISDYRRYNLPPPRAGYRYYRDRNGDIVMAAVATGIIGLIIGSQLRGDGRRW